LRVRLRQVLLYLFIFIYLFILYNYITVHDAKNIKLPNVLSRTYKKRLYNLFEQCTNHRLQREQGTDEGMRLTDITSSSTPTHVSMQQQYLAKGKLYAAVT